MTKRQQQQNLSQSQDGGYTIIESLVAMIVVSVLMIAIAPVMAFSVATRVQARRVELATQAARTYIDALRTGAIKPGVPGFPIRVLAGDLADAPVPPVGDTYCVDMDGDTTPQPCDKSSNKDFRVQGAWLNTDVTTGSDPTSKGYQLLVRVYRADSFDGTLNLKPPRNATKQSVVGSGLGDRTMPVVEMSTQIPPTTGETSPYESLCARLKNTTNRCQ
jgi:prepilin-type N-terminal cleavage/methylation domain-containing protein